MDAPPAIATFLIPDKKITIDAHELESIRLAAIEYLRKLKRDDKTQFVEELKEATPLVDERRVPRLGRWLLEERDAKLWLVRHPPRTPVMHFILLEVTRTENQWEIVSISDERVTSR